MLMQIGTVVFEGNAGPSLDGYERSTKGELARKPLISSLAGKEWTGWDGDLSLSGTILPFHLGGLGSIEDLHAAAAEGRCLPVIRGDGRNLGWYGISEVKESHKTLSASGVGYEVGFSVQLMLVEKPSAGSIDALLSAAEALITKIAGAAAGAIASLFG